MAATAWDLTKLYKTEADFEAELAAMKEVATKMASYKGKLNEPKCFDEFLTLEATLNDKLSRIYSYASMSSDLNKKDVNRSTRLSNVMIAWQTLGSALSFEEPEIIGLGKEYVDKFIKEHPAHEQFSFIFEKLFRGQTHVLTPDSEKLLSYYSPIVGEGRTLYSQLSVADYSGKEITLSDGEKVTVTQANWTALIPQVKTAEDRQKVFEALYSYYEAHKSTYGEIYNLTLQSQLAAMKARGYKSILEEHLYGNAIPEEVFLNLIDVASKGSAPLQKYYRIKAKALGLEKLRSYDRFLQIAKSEKKYSYDESRELFFKSIEGFPADFQDKAREVSADGYVDVYPANGKRTGAYSNGGSNMHPFILLNHLGELNDVFTLAHESGHSIHTLYSMENQPIMKQDYTIFVAEIASTFNEHNLLDYLFTHEKLSKNDRIYLLQKEIDEICSTFYRQTLFGHYEYLASKKAENGEPINYQVLCDIMKELYMTYYGIDIEEEKLKSFVWAYIPHLFNSPFYVYQYATSFTSSMLIYKRVKEKEEGAFEGYINLLKSGGSDFPVEQVKKAGVDLTTKAPFEAVVARMSELVDLLEKELESK